jgi:DNA-binding MurR/RpiR family transcriptional regulator
MTAGAAPAAGADLRRLAAGVRLTPTQRRVLAHLVDHAAELPWLSAGEVAARAGVSQPSVTRLANVLGFDGYARLREELRRRPAPPAPPDRIAAALEGEVAALSRLGAVLPDAAAWAGIGRALRGSAPVVVAGFRAGRYLATYTAYLLRKVHPDVAEVDHGGAEALDRLVEAADSGATAAVVVCVARYPAETVAFLAAAHRLGLRVVLVADEVMPPVPGAPPAWTIGVPVGARLTFDAHPAALVALSMLVEAVCDARPAATEARLEALDAAAAGARTYWTG